MSDTLYGDLTCRCEGRESEVARTPKRRTPKRKEKQKEKPKEEERE